MTNSNQSPMRLIVNGASGRMGKAIISAISKRSDCTLHAAIERKASPHLGKDAGELAGCGHLGVQVSDSPHEALLTGHGIIDFTTTSSTVAMVRLAAQARVVHIIGTTGLSEADQQKIDAASYHARIVQSGNMSLGVNMLAVLVEKAAKALDSQFDIEIMEMHHKHKIDAPSGTALLLGEAAAAGRSVSLEQQAVMSREGHVGPRKEGQIGFATLRGGSVVGDHSVIFAGEGERITLSHSAQSRDIFALGAIKAALWAYNQKPGLYTMREVLGI